MNYNKIKAVESLFDFEFDIDFQKVSTQELAEFVREPSEKELDRLNELYDRFYELRNLYLKIYEDSFKDREMYAPGWVSAYKERFDQLDDLIREHVDSIIEFDQDAYDELIKEKDLFDEKEAAEYIREVRRRY